MDPAGWLLAGVAAWAVAVVAWRRFLARLEYRWTARFSHHRFPRSTTEEAIWAWNEAQETLARARKEEDATHVALAKGLESRDSWQRSLDRMDKEPDGVRTETWFERYSDVEDRSRAAQLAAKQLQGRVNEAATARFDAERHLWSLQRQILGPFASEFKLQFKHASIGVAGLTTGGLSLASSLARNGFPAAALMPWAVGTALAALALGVAFHVPAFVVHFRDYIRQEGNLRPDVRATSVQYGALVMWIQFGVLLAQLAAFGLMVAVICKMTWA